MMKVVLFVALCLVVVRAASVEEEAFDILDLEEDETPLLEKAEDAPLLDDTDDIVSIDASVVAHMTAKDTKELEPESISDLYDVMDEATPVTAPEAVANVADQ